MALQRYACDSRDHSALIFFLLVFEYCQLFQNQNLLYLLSLESENKISPKGTKECIG